MGLTIVEKIMQAHSNEPVEAGKIIWIDIDLRSARDFGGANVVKNFRQHYPGMFEETTEPGGQATDSASWEAEVNREVGLS